MEKKPIKIDLSDVSRAYLGVTGEAATNPKVIAEKERIRKSGGDEVELVKWIARKLANAY